MFMALYIPGTCRFCLYLPKISAVADHTIWKKIYSKMLIKYINVLYSFIIHFFLNSNTVWYLFVPSVLFTLTPRWAQMSDGRFLFLTSNNTRVLTTLVFTSSHAREINKIIPPRRRSDNIRPYRYIVRREEKQFYFLRWLMYGGGGGSGLIPHNKSQDI